MSWAAGEFAAHVVRWWRRHGRKDLPWQRTRDPYLVWLSEIMLQQTQVASVLGYYPRFLIRFPDVQALARAPEEDVLAAWSGLGYYSRARNLHRCARAVVATHGGKFPTSAAQLEDLPGIGRSTAAAIAAFCFGERRAILDGNVKRVLARAFAIGDDLSRGKPLQALWLQAEALLPRERLRTTMPAYTQGLMDLGATVCTARRPACHRCPLADRCLARAEGAPERYPVRLPRPLRRTVPLWLLHAVGPDGRIWMMQRSATGIWARLHCLPTFGDAVTLERALHGIGYADRVEHPVVTHLLTHRTLELHIITAWVGASFRLDDGGCWMAAERWQDAGLPAPVRRFLMQQSS